MTEWIFPARSGDWEMPQDKLVEYREAYQELEVDMLLRRARQWLRDNPKRRPKSVPRFLTNWLNKNVSITKKQTGELDRAIREIEGGS